jgi:hypothetical protein
MSWRGGGCGELYADPPSAVSLAAGSATSFLPVVEYCDFKKTRLKSYTIWEQEELYINVAVDPLVLKHRPTAYVRWQM